jgi:hypothetical protein
MKHSGSYSSARVGCALFLRSRGVSVRGVNKIPSPISTHLPGRSCAALRCIQIFPAPSNSVSFIISLASSCSPLQQLLPSSGAALMSYMMYGIKYFEHVESFYVSWISKKAKEISRFVLSQRRERNFKSIKAGWVGDERTSKRFLFESKGIFGIVPSGGRRR